MSMYDVVRQQIMHTRLQRAVQEGRHTTEYSRLQQSPSPTPGQCIIHIVACHLTGEHGWRAPKRARTAHWLKPPTYWVTKNTKHLYKL